MPNESFHNPERTKEEKERPIILQWTKSIKIVQVGVHKDFISFEFFKFEFGVLDFVKNFLLYNIFFEFGCS